MSKKTNFGLCQGLILCFTHGAQNLRYGTAVSAGTRNLKILEKGGKGKQEKLT
jgi:hypothetical protein